MFLFGFCIIFTLCSVPVPIPYKLFNVSYQGEEGLEKSHEVPGTVVEVNNYQYCLNANLYIYRSSSQRKSWTRSDQSKLGPDLES
jgi:hypothetical protein